MGADHVRWAANRLGAVGAVVEKDQVKVGVVLELPLAELAHGEHGEASAFRGAVLAFLLGLRQGQGRSETGLRQVGELRDGFVKGQLAAELVEAQAYEPFDTVAPQTVEAVLDVGGFPDGGVRRRCRLGQAF